MQIERYVIVAGDYVWTTLRTWRNAHETLSPRLFSEKSEARDTLPFAEATDPPGPARVAKYTVTIEEA